ncbi:hypothetical protein FKM82_003500 [Ascaphus truei]
MGVGRSPGLWNKMSSRTLHFSPFLCFQELKNLASENANLVLLQLDATDIDSIKEAMKKVEKQLNGSGLNLLINNAGVMTSVSLENVDSEDMMSVYKTNVVGPLLVSQTFYPLLKKSADVYAQEHFSCKKAALVNISSSLGSIAQTSLAVNASMQVISYRISKVSRLGDYMYSQGVKGGEVKE